jgi:electron transfer flavoprotein alpha/beta subunit
VAGASELDLEDSELGLTGSYTQVVKIFPPVGKSGGVKLEGMDAATAARKIASFLHDKEIIKR